MSHLQARGNLQDETILAGRQVYLAKVLWLQGAIQLFNLAITELEFLETKICQQIQAVLQHLKGCLGS